MTPIALQEIEARLSALFNLARKLRVRPDELQAHWQAIESKFEQLAAAQDIAALERAALAADGALTAAAATLTQSAPLLRVALADAATAELPDLALANAAFAINPIPLPAVESTGAEGVEFAFARTPVCRCAAREGGVRWRAGAELSLGDSGHLR